MHAAEVRSRSRALAADFYGWRDWPWGPIIFLHAIFFLANLDVQNIPFPLEQSPTLTQIVTASDEGMIGRRIAFLVLGAFAFCCLITTDARRLVVRGGLGVLMVAFFAWSVASVGWADDAALAVRKVGVFVLVWIGAIWAAIRLSPADLLRFSFVSCVITALTCLVVEVAFGRFGFLSDGYRFSGVFQPNETGQYLFVAVLAAAVLAIENRQRMICIGYATVASVSFILLLLTGSRTALISAVFAILTYWSVLAVANRRSMTYLIGFIAAITTVGALVYLIFGSEVLMGLPSGLLFDRADSDIATLTERTPLWHALVNDYLSVKPWTGYGFGSFWTTEHLSSMALLRKGTAYFHSHSGYLEMALGIGIVGAMVHVITILLSLLRLLRTYWQTREQGSAFGVALLGALLVSMVAEPTNMAYYLLPSFVAMAFMARCAFMRFEYAQDRFEYEVGYHCMNRRRDCAAL